MLPFTDFTSTRALAVPSAYLWYYSKKICILMNIINHYNKEQNIRFYTSCIEVPSRVPRYLSRNSLFWKPVTFRNIICCSKSGNITESISSLFLVILKNIMKKPKKQIKIHWKSPINWIQYKYFPIKQFEVLATINQNVIICSTLWNIRTATSIAVSVCISICCYIQIMTNSK